MPRVRHFSASMDKRAPCFTDTKQGARLSIDAEKCLTLGISKIASEQISLLREKWRQVSGDRYSRDSESVFSFLKKK